MNLFREKDMESLTSRNPLALRAWGKSLNSIDCSTHGEQWPGHWCVTAFGVWKSHCQASSHGLAQVPVPRDSDSGGQSQAQASVSLKKLPLGGWFRDSSKTENHWPGPWVDRAELPSGDPKGKRKSSPHYKLAFHRVEEAEANMLLSMNYPRLTTNKLEKGGKECFWPFFWPCFSLFVTFLCYKSDK